MKAAQSSLRPVFWFGRHLTNSRAIKPGGALGHAVDMRVVPLLLALVFVLPLVPAASASAICPPEDCLEPVPIPEEPYLRAAGIALDRFAADIQVQGPLATTRIEMDLRNPGAAAQQAELAISFPLGAAVTAFNLTVNGTLIEGRVTESGAARTEYTANVAAGRDAALLESVGDRQLRLSVSVPPGEVRVLRAAYTEVVPLHSNNRVYRLPTSNLANAGLAVAVLDLHIAIDDASGVTGLRFPAHPMKVTESEGTHAAAASLEAPPAAIDDLVAVWSAAEGGWAPAVFASAAPGTAAAGDSCVLVTLSQLGSVPVLPRDVVFVIDRSGSMSGHKIDQARESLREVLLQLRPGDRYDIIAFDDVVEPFISALDYAAADSVSADRATLAGLQARGSTNIDGALQKALALLTAAESGSGRVPAVVFLTDGLPTAGVTDANAILARFQEANTMHASLHAVVIGADADQAFLHDLALASGGTALVMDPDEGDLAGRLASFYDRIDQPVATSLAANITGPAVQAMLPDPLPTLYRDGTLQLLLRADWSAATPLQLQLAGLGGDGKVAESFTFDPSAVAVRPEVCSLWGRAAVDTLLAQERAEGTSQELQDAIRDNGTLYRIASPYTSWIIAAPLPVVSVQERELSVVDNKDSDQGGNFDAVTLTWSQPAASQGAPSSAAGPLPSMTPAAAPTPTVMPANFQASSPAMRIASGGSGGVYLDEAGNGVQPREPFHTAAPAHPKDTTSGIPAPAPMPSPILIVAALALLVVSWAAVFGTARRR